MKSRPEDTKYCGVDEEKIKSAHPEVNIDVLKMYAEYTKERTDIYFKKEILKIPAPWSEKKIFQDIKWTMTKRWLDRESKNLINGILLREDISLENKILNAVMFRMTNKWMLFEVFPNNYIDFSKDLTKSDLEKIKSIIVDSGISGFFTGAYFISGLLRSISLQLYGSDKNIPKKQSNPTDSVINIIKFIDLNKQKIIESAFASTQDLVTDGLESLKGIGKFIAYQSFVDFTYIPEYKFSETDYVKAGPGAEKGLKYLFKNFDGLNFAEAIFWFRDNVERLTFENDIEWSPKEWFHFLPEENRVWTVMDIQNSCCELDKLSRICTPELMAENFKRVRKFAGVGEVTAPAKKPKVVKTIEIQSTGLDNW